MNIRQSLKVAAFALPLSMGAPKASAQAVRVTEGAQKVLTGAVKDSLGAAKDSLKAVVRDPRTVELGNYSGHFHGGVVNGKIGNGTLDYAEKGKTVLYEPNTRPNINVGAQFITAKNLPAPGFKIMGGLEKNKNQFDVEFAYASKNGYSDMIANASYTRNVPLVTDLTAYGRVGADNIIRREAFEGGDHHGILTPNLVAGLKYDHKFPNKIKVGASAEVGGGPAIYFRTDAGKTLVKRNIKYNGELRLGYDKIEAFANVGKDDILGTQLGVGGRYNF